MVPSRWRTALKLTPALAPFLPRPATDDVRRFVLMSSPRSGTSWIIDLLNSHRDVCCFSEIFAHDHYGNMPHGGAQEVATWDSFATLRLPSLGRWGRFRLFFEYLDQEVFSSKHGALAVGCKMMYFQAQRGFAIPAYLKIRQVAILHLIRHNHLDVILSEEARKVRKFYHAADGADVEAVKIELELPTLEHRLRERQQTTDAAIQGLAAIGAPCLQLSYEDLLEDDQQLDQVLQFIGVQGDRTELRSSFRKLSPHDHRETIANYDDVKRTLSSTPFAKLVR